MKSTPCIKDDKDYICSCDACMEERVERIKQQATKNAELMEAVMHPDQHKEQLRANLKNYWITFNTEEKAHAKRWLGR